MSEPTGHDAGFAANVASGQACWIVVNRAGSCLGSTTPTLRMLACTPLGNVVLTVRLAPSCLLVFACVLTVKTGWNGRTAQFAAWKRAETPAVAPWVLVNAPV